MNTMLMTVFERAHEISILLAIGWKRSASSE
jgi:ABC-type antimicrobial peptide transport system permease subunit